MMQNGTMRKFRIGEGRESTYTYYYGILLLYATKTTAENYIVYMRVRNKGKNWSSPGQDLSHPARRIISFAGVRRFTNWSRA